MSAADAWTVPPRRSLAADARNMESIFCRILPPFEAGWVLFLVVFAGSEGKSLYIYIYIHTYFIELAERVRIRQQRKSLNADHTRHPHPQPENMPKLIRC